MCIRDRPCFVEYPRPAVFGEDRLREYGSSVSYTHLDVYKRQAWYIPNTSKASLYQPLPQKYTVSIFSINLVYFKFSFIKSNSKSDLIELLFFLDWTKNFNLILALNCYCLLRFLFLQDFPL